MRKPNSLDIGFVEIAKRSVKKAYLEDDMLMYAAALAFRTFFALIPSLIFLVALLGFLRVPGFFEWLLGKAQNVLSKDALGQVKLVLEQVQDQAHGGFLAFAAVAVAIWYGSVGVRSLMTALNTPGAVLAVTVWIAASLGFHYYVLNLSMSRKLWVWFLCSLEGVYR
jgi:uncharacterized BrkB/YihY/UPF0761 family membrane protein